MPIEKDSLGNDITVDKATFIRVGSIRKPKPITGDGIKNDIQVVGLISDMELKSKN